MTKEQADQLRDILNRIQALCENPHWTADRRWRIAELAVQARRISEQ